MFDRASACTLSSRARDTRLSLGNSDAMLTAVMNQRWQLVRDTRAAAVRDARGRNADAYGGGNRGAKGPEDERAFPAPAAFDEVLCASDLIVLVCFAWLGLPRVCLSTRFFPCMPSLFQAAHRGYVELSHARTGRLGAGRH
jgi:hypothetical protein